MWSRTTYGTTENIYIFVLDIFRWYSVRTQDNKDKEIRNILRKQKQNNFNLYEFQYYHVASKIKQRKEKKIQIIIEELK